LTVFQDFVHEEQADGFELEDKKAVDIK